MTEATVNLMAQTIRANNRVVRGLRGALPRSLAKRFRHLLRPAATVMERVDHSDGSVTYTEVTLSHLGLAGHLRAEAWRAIEADLRTKLQSEVTA